MTDARKCEGCGAMTPAHLLDSRPANVPGDAAALAAAADRGDDFDHEYCRKCYGSAWMRGIG